MSKVVVIGLDGAGFHLLDRWLDGETLPNLSQFMKEGVWQRLRSSYPPVTSPAWRCYSTGVNPGKHGVFWWEVIDKADRSITVPDSRSFTAKNIWDYLGTNDYSSGIINMPTTHPPESIEGWMVSGVGFDENYTYPNHLETELEEKIDYKNSLAVPKYELRNDPDKITETNKLIDARFQAAKYIRNEYDPDFLHLTVFVTNAVQHHVWGGEATKRMWQCVDRNIGELLQDDDNVVIMSDHGSNEIEWVFYINSWLQNRGYLHTEFTPTDLLNRVGFNKETGIKLAETLNVKQELNSVIPNSIIRRFPGTEGGVGRDGKETKLDWGSSSAVASGQGPIYILEHGERRQQIVDELIEALSQLRTPNGQPVARNVLDATDVYEGPYVDDGPDIVIDQADGIHIPDKVGAASEFVRADDWKWESENHRDGIFMAHGPDVASTGELSEQPTLYDIAPTILHWYGLPIPNGCDGEVLSEIYEADSDPASRDVRHEKIPIQKEDSKSTDLEDDEMLDRLKDLGYISE